MLRTAAFASILLALVQIPQPEPPVTKCHFRHAMELRAGEEPLCKVESSRPVRLSFVPPRPAVEVPLDRPIEIRYRVTALASNPLPIRDVTVHTYLTPVKRAGIERPPPLRDEVVHESALLMDFAPGEGARGDFRVKLPAPGTYLLRVETIGLAESEAHEHSCELDLRAVERKAEEPENVPGPPGKPQESKP